LLKLPPIPSHPSKKPVQPPPQQRGRSARPARRQASPTAASEEGREGAAARQDGSLPPVSQPQPGAEEEPRKRAQSEQPPAVSSAAEAVAKRNPPLQPKAAEKVRGKLIDVGRVDALGLAQVESMLSRFDADGCGQLPDDTVRRALRKGLKVPAAAVSDGDVSSLCALLDPQENGKVELAKLLDFMSPASKPKPRAPRHGSGSRRPFPQKAPPASSDHPAADEAVAAAAAAPPQKAAGSAAAASQPAPSRQEKQVVSGKAGGRGAPASAAEAGRATRADDAARKKAAGVKSGSAAPAEPTPARHLAPAAASPAAVPPLDLTAKDRAPQPTSAEDEDVESVVSDVIVESAREEKQQQPDTARTVATDIAAEVVEKAAVTTAQPTPREEPDEDYEESFEEEAYEDESFAEESVKTEEPEPSEEVDGGLENCAFIFIKPHAQLPKVRELLKQRLQKNKLEIVAQGDISSAEIDAKGLVDQHYYAIASKAVILPPEKLTMPVQKFADKFGEDWQDVVAAGRAMNARQACSEFGLDAYALERMWKKCGEDGNIVKLGGVFYCGRMQFGSRSVYVINAFFMTMRSKYTSPGASIHYCVVRWSASRLSWADFRAKVLGATNPAVANEGSLRREALQRWQDLGLESEPDTGNNCFHASASPFESLVERANWLAVDISKDSFGSALLNSGFTVDKLREWFVDPQVPQPDGSSGSVFDALEDLDADLCLERATSLLGVGDSPQEKRDAQEEKVRIRRLSVELLEGRPPLQQQQQPVVKQPQAPVEATAKTTAEVHPRVGSGHAEGGAAVDNVVRPGSEMPALVPEAQEEEERLAREEEIDEEQRFEDELDELLQIVG